MLEEFGDESIKLISCMDDLLRAAQVINHKLHRKNQIEGSDVDIDAESKNTRRNSQYKSMALNLIWYFAYRYVNGKDPPPKYKCGGEWTTCKNPNDNLLKKDCDNEKKDHYTKFNNKDYTFEMVTVLTKNMNTLIDFAFQEYCGNLKEYMKDYINMKKHVDGEHEALRVRAKRPHILSKLYCAMLLETDLEELFKLVLLKLRTKYCKHQINKLLQAAVDHVCNKYLPINERSVHIEKLKNSLKLEQLHTVASRLLDWGRKLKYSNFPMVDSVQDDDISLLDIKKFESHRRNVDSIYYYASSVPLNLKVENYDRKYGGIVVLVEFSCPARHTKYIYDCLSHPTYTKEKLATFSWKQRLDLVLNLSSEINVPTITVEEIKLEQLQFENYPGGNNNYHYVRTTGFGYGTSFIRSVPGQKKRSVRQPTVLNKRHKKVKLEDLNETEVIVCEFAYQTAVASPEMGGGGGVFHEPCEYFYSPPRRSPSPPQSVFSLDCRKGGPPTTTNNIDIRNMVGVILYEPHHRHGVLSSTTTPHSAVGGQHKQNVAPPNEHIPEVVYDI